MAGLFSNLVETILAGKRDQNIVQGFQKLIEEERTGLDVGCGDGRLSKKIQEQLNLELVGVDVYQAKNPKINVLLFDGQKLPFPDNSFDSVFLIDMLHHTQNSEILLKESLRVAKKSVLIKDHYYQNKFELRVLKIADWLGNFLAKVHTPFYFKSKQEWTALLQSFDFQIIEWRSSIFPAITFPQVIYKISK
ncbi:MAG: class I SAM-dependent methyltransferase [Candidatus Diapherotrites archaeon]|nr:class I SAM-dependent methyltransferase [Candidatus Diapherotrites archaeon]